MLWITVHNCGRESPEPPALPPRICVSAPKRHAVCQPQKSKNPAPLPRADVPKLKAHPKNRPKNRLP